MHVTAAQLRAARALLDLGEVDLADRARVSVAMIRHIELHEHICTLPSDEIDALRLALEEAGVEFIDRGVRWRQGPPEKVEV